MIYPLYAFVAIGLCTAFSILILGKIREWLAPLVAVIAASVLFALSLNALSAAHTGLKIFPMGKWMPPVGIVMMLDNLTGLMLVTVNFIGLMALIYSVPYIKRFTSTVYYYSLFMLMLTGMNGVVVTGDLFNLYVFLEITSIASYGLVAFGVESEELEAAFKYLILSSIASTMIFLGIGIIFIKTSTLNMADIAMTLASQGAAGKNALLLATVVFLCGFAFKAALVPFHAWLPDAHPSAPAPVSSMLSGLVIKVLGAYAICRVMFNVIGITPAVLSVLLALGLISMIVGVLLAIRQTDFKRLLAFHSISQMGYIITGISIGTPLGIAAGLFHLFNHSVFKSLLFMNAGSVEYATGTRRMERLGNLNKKMPVTGITSLIASLSIAGIPPLNGFWSKLFIIIALFQAGFMKSGIVAIIVSIMTLASFLKVQKMVFYRKIEDAEDPINIENVREVPFLMQFSMVILAAVCVIAGLYFLPLTKTVFEPAAKALTDGFAYVKLVIPGG